MADVNYGFYIGADGTPIVLPNAGIAPRSGIKEVPFDQWKQIAQSHIQGDGRSMYQQLMDQGGTVATAIKGAEGGQTTNYGQTDSQGNLVSSEALNSMAENEKAVANGTMTKTMINGVPVYQPVGAAPFVAGSSGQPGQLSYVDPSKVPSAPAGYSNASMMLSPASSMPTANLQPGDKSDSVTQLQKYLISQGINIPSLQNGSASYGYYGPETQAAVQQLQQQLGVPVPKGQEGYFGPLTQAAISSAAAKSTPASSVSTNAAFASTGDPKLDAAFASLKGMYDNIVSSGAYTPNANINITPDLVSKFLAEAHQVVDPYTQQTLTDNIKGINSAIQNAGTQYQAQRDQTTQDFQTNLATSRESDAGNGVAFSGLRGLNEGNAAASTNRSLNALDATYANNIGGILRTGAANVGNGVPGLNGSSGDFSTPQLNGAQVDTSGARGNVSAGGALNYNYDPNAYKVGSIGSTYGTNLLGQSNSFLSNYQKSAANNGARTFQDLNGTPTLY